jgi:hypothetical protein
MAYVGRTPSNAVLTSSDIEDGVVIASKIATDAVETVKVKADNITNAKTEFTPGLEIKGDGASAAGKLTLNCEQNTHAVHIQSPAHSAGAGYTLTLPTGVGTDGQVLSTDGTSTNQLAWIDAVEVKPTVTAVSAVIPPSIATSVTITGTNFASDSTHVPIVEAVSSTNAYTRASVVSWTSATSISATFNLALGDYRVRVENPDGNAGMSTNAILQSSTAPTWTTAAGSLGTFAAEAAISETVVASSDSAVTYAKTSGSFPGGVTLATATGVISGTETGSSATTTYTFEITPTDAESQVGAAREFTMTISHGASGGGQFN